MTSNIADWRECLEICLDSHFLCARRAAPVMKAQGSGIIINISSTAGLYGFGKRSPYAAAKWAVIGFTKSLAIELGPHDVRCNAICPGAVRGDRIDRVIAGRSRVRGVAFDVVAKEMTWSQSITRFVEPDEIADMCLFLASAPPPRWSPARRSPSMAISKPCTSGADAMDFALSEEQDMIVKTTRDFVENELYPA